MLYTIIYISRATEEVTSETLEDILKSSSNNPSIGVSGMLIYKDGEFMQALKARKDTVQILMDKISKDKRHDEILILSKKAIPHRYFKKLEHGL